MDTVIKKERRIQEKETAECRLFSFKEGLPQGLPPSISNKRGDIV